MRLRHTLARLFCLGAVASALGPCSAAEAPYTVHQVTFDPKIYRMGSGDNWHTTWAMDGRQFTVLGDGGGASPSGSRWNTRVYELLGDPPNHQFGFLTNYPNVPESFQHWYGYGIIALDRRLYHFISYIEHGAWHGIGSLPDRFRGARLVYSEDLGQTWKFQDGSAMSFNVSPPQKMFFWEEPDWTFSLLSILQFGRNYEENRDGFVYLYAPNGWAEGKMNQLALARVPKDQILNRAAYEFFVSRDAEGAASWSGDIKSRGSVHTFPAGWVGNGLAYSWHPSVAYNKQLGLFMMAAAGTGKDGSFSLSQPSSLGIYTSPKPWGPWQEVYWTNKWIINSTDDRLYEPVIAPKWIDDDGKSFYLIHSNSRGSFSPTYYLFNVQKVTLTIDDHRPRLEIHKEGNSAVIRWPETYGQFSVETSSSIDSSRWAAISQENPWTNALDGRQQFFRLRQQ